MPVPTQVSHYKSLKEITSCTKLVAIFRDTLKGYQRVYNTSQRRPIISDDTVFYIVDKRAPYDVRGCINDEANDAEVRRSSLGHLYLTGLNSPFNRRLGQTTFQVSYPLLSSCILNDRRSMDTHRCPGVVILGYDPSAAQHNLSCIREKYSILDDPSSLVFVDIWERPAMRKLVDNLASFFKAMFLWRWEHYKIKRGNSEIPELAEEAQDDFKVLDEYFQEALDDIEEEDVQCVWQFVNKSVSEDITRRYAHRGGR
ncbi:hypothetical protein BJ165DRAFT_1615430 [Panaeolus papilionaceus]|nr:hypothetical protein BJ165DRAFT_1615430 [Panaeolus papilionaceus]